MKNETNNAEIVGRARFNLSDRLTILHAGICSFNFRNLNAETVETWANKVNELTEQARELENRIEVFQKAQSNIVGELIRRGDDELIGLVNDWVNEGDK